MSGTVFYPRRVRGLLLESLQDSPAVVIHGPRQCGKTTLAQAVRAPEHLNRSWRPAAGAATGPTYAYITFDDDAARNASRADPVGFVADLPDRVVLDEVQRVPELFAAIKLSIDRDRRPGRFVLTGSANVLMVPGLADSLAGRMQVLRLHPLWQAELAEPGRPVASGNLPRQRPAGYRAHPDLIQLCAVARGEPQTRDAASRVRRARAGGG